MVTLKTPEEIEILRMGGRILATVLNACREFTLNTYATRELTAKEINALAEQMIEALGAKPAFKGHTYRRGLAPFPAVMCISINDAVVHGIPGDQVIREGDIVSLDLGVVYAGMYTDAAISFIAGQGTKDEEMLLSVTEQALHLVIEQIKIGDMTGSIGYAIERYLSQFPVGIVRDYTGHGVGYGVHEDPSIPNYGSKNSGVPIEEGMVIAIEPMVTLGAEDVEVLDDGWTVVTSDGSRVAHFEHTVAITKDGPQILTEF